jgi:thiol-disulfide isomerase/thioredoxin
MDRLPALSPIAIAALALTPLLAACTGGGEKTGPARTEVVAATARTPAPEAWCDAYYTGDGAPALALPKVVPARPGEPLPTVPAERWVWVNLWATWCEPCRREMPLLVRWQGQLVKEGVAVDLLFVSVDEREQDLVAFLRANPTMAPGESVRLAAFSELEPWLARFKGAPSGTIPLQIIAAPGGKVRCIRAGSLREGDLPVVRQLFSH